MSSFADVFKNLALQPGFATLTWKHYVMILIACVFMYLAIVKGFEPLLLVPISFGMFLVNMFPDIIADGGLLHYFYLLDEWSILPSLIEQIQVEQVQKMFHILNAIQVPVDVEVTVLDDIWESFRILLHSRNLSRLLDRARTVCDISNQPSTIQ